MSEWTTWDVLLIGWDAYEIEGGRRYLYVPGDGGMPTYILEDMLAIAKDYQSKLSAAERKLEEAKSDLAIVCNELFHTVYLGELDAATRRVVDAWLATQESEEEREWVEGALEDDVEYG